MSLQLGIEWKLRELQAQLDKTPGMTKTAAKKMVKAFTDELKAAEDAAAKKLNISKRVEGEAKALKELGKALGGTFGGAANLIEDVVGAAGAGLTPVTGLAAGLVAVGLAAGAAVMGTASVARGIDELAGSLTEADQRALAPHIASLKDTKAALEGWDYQATRLKIVLASELSPAVGGLTNVVAGLTSEATNAISSVTGLTDVSGSLYDVWSRFTTTGQVVEYFRAAGEAAQVATAEVSKFYAESERANDDGVPRWLQAMPDQVPESIRRIDNPASNRPSTAAPSVGWDGAEIQRLEAQVLSEARRAATEHIRLIDEVAAASAEASAAADAISAAAILDLQSEKQAIRARFDAELEAIDELREAKADALSADRAEAAVRKRMGRELDSLRERQRDEAYDAAQSTVQWAATGLDALLSIAQSAVDMQIENAERHRDETGKLTAEGKKQYLEAFYAQRGIAVAQIAVQTAVASIQALASTPFPANFVVAGLVLGAGVAAGALAGTRQPTIRHDGGMLGRQVYQPDEVGVRALEGEAVLSRRGVRAAGGPEGVARFNEGGAAPRGVTVVQVLRHRTMDVFLQDGMRRPGSVLRRAQRDADRVAGQRRRFGWAG